MSHVLTIGAADAEHLSIAALRREFPGSTDFWDGNWLICQLDLRVSGFTASIESSLHTEELRRFNEGLKFIDANLFGAATLTSMEDWIDLTITCTSSGTLNIAGTLRDGTDGNALSFELPPKDQTYLAGWITDFDALLAAFPVVGKR